VHTLLGGDFLMAKKGQTLNSYSAETKLKAEMKMEKEVIKR
jgi:hypothetical protein